MRITAEILKKHGACEKGILYIQKAYPNGVELIDIINDPHVEKEMLHWGRKSLNHTAEELEAYCKACNIVNTEGHWYCVDVRDSKNVVKSTDVKNCERVFHSNDVYNSFDVVNGDSVSNSSQVFASAMIDLSKKILHCANITSGENICFSTAIGRSKNVFESKNIFYSSEIIKCENVTSSHFCQNCKNIKYCLFCSEIENAEYYIFNQPVDKERFDLFVEQYIRFMDAELEFSPEWPSDLSVAYAPSITRKIFDWYKPVQPKFWKWARTLPNFDSMMLYNMTFLPEILVEK